MSPRVRVVEVGVPGPAGPPGENGTGGGGAQWVEVPISTDEGDWDNVEGGWVFNGDGTVSSVDLGGQEAYARLPLPAAALVNAAACCLRMVGRITDSAGPPDCWFGINDGSNHGFTRAVELFWQGHAAFLTYDRGGVTGDFETAIGLDTDITVDVLFIGSRAEAVWLDGEPFASFTDVSYPQIGVIGFGLPFANINDDPMPFLLLQSGSGIAGLSFDLSACRLLVPANPLA